MLLQDFNYYINKAINQYINKRYNIYDINQQTSDDLRVLKATTILTPKKVNHKLSEFTAGSSKLFGGTYEVNMPLDYMHILNCICVYQVGQQFKCYDKDDMVQFAAKRLTADTWSIILNDYYNRPLPWRPYYYIHHVNTDTDIPTNPINNTDILDSTTIGTDSISNYGKQSVIVYVVKYEDENNNQYTNNSIESNYEINTFKKNNPDYKIIETIEVLSSVEKSEISNLPRTISLKNIKNSSLVEKKSGVRYGNSTNVRMEIRYGQDDTFTLKNVLVDYIKSPQYIRLTQEQVNLTKDTSQIMEFPDYVCQEIINELVLLVMENTADPRLQTHSIVTQSIANPVQQQAQTKSDKD